jgi:hypothetical protein
MQAANIEPTIQGMFRAARGTGVESTAADGDRNSSKAGNTASSPVVLRLLGFDERWAERCMARTLAIEMAILLRPELTVQGAAF